jgi:hypothetical protein
MHAEEPEDAGVEQISSGDDISEVVAEWNLAAEYPNSMLEVEGLIERHDERSSSQGEGAEIKECEGSRGERDIKAPSDAGGGPDQWLEYGRL